MILYEIRNNQNNFVYVGITRSSSIKRRWAGHRHSAKKKINTPLYCAINKYGIENFTIFCVAIFDNEEDLKNAECCLVNKYKKEKVSYNILDGGQSYFPIVNKEAWKQKLREKRKGKQPALGMKHTEDNKKLFSMCGKLRWDLHGRYPKNIVTLDFYEANKKYGISKTHFYRLRKQAKSSELC
ncbi:GIY-YIG nuclease family protein [Microcystis sp. M42BS1]|uniref:GIY-YIG nuclease family protein n=1 Tax=Microcystis sp. M42BS1 TaxID=2771192 RepID=UPI002587F69A|nr:GIY-YIG nuclease family protein [Microcystis sp. M42BS1]MCA2570650.1 GIY-YIG nuclease family protein [Microcystis sp. M42BS1]